MLFYLCSISLLEYNPVCTVMSNFVLWAYVGTRPKSMGGWVHSSAVVLKKKIGRDISGFNTRKIVKNSVSWWRCFVEKKNRVKLGISNYYEMSKPSLSILFNVIIGWFPGWDSPSVLLRNFISVQSDREMLP